MFVLASAFGNPHTTKYSSLVDAVQYMGCDYFKRLHHAENTKYKSQRIISEFLQVMATQVEKKKLEHVLSSEFFSLMIDESTDIAVVNEMVIYARYVQSGKVATTFLNICELPNGTADTIETTLLAYMDENNLSVSKMMGLGTDGAAVMTGKRNGVAARFKRRQPLLTSIHCVCHRLALAAAHAGNDVPYIHHKFKPTLSQLFYFYQNSSVRISGLQAIERLLESPELKLKKPADTRWLSSGRACQTLVRVFPAVCVSLSREAQERGDALAIGLSNVVRKYNFVASLYMMCDILPPVSRLSCILQSSHIDLSQLHSLVSSTIETLELLCLSKGPRYNMLDFDLENSLAGCEISVTPELKHQFHTRVYLPFIKALTSHIKERLPDTEIFAAFSILDPAKLPPTSEEIVSQNYGEVHVNTLEKHYGNGDSAIVNSDSFKSEWFELRLYLSMHCHTLSVTEVLHLLTTDTTLSLAYPNFVKLAQVCLTLPISTADCEREFSTMRRIKTRLRSEMNNATLNHCMRISIEGPPLQEFDFDTAVEKWSTLRKRRIFD